MLSTSSAGSVRPPCRPGRWQGDTAGQPLPSPALRAPAAHRCRTWYLTDASHASHHLLGVAIVLHGPLAEEEVDLVIVPREAPHTLRDIGRAYEVGFWGKARRVSGRVPGPFKALPLSSSPVPLHDAPFSQNARYSVLIEWWGPMFRRITGSVPRKLLSVAENSSPSMGRRQMAGQPS